MKINFNKSKTKKPLEQRKKELLEKVKKEGEKLELELYLKNKKENNE